MKGRSGYQEQKGGSDGTDQHSCRAAQSQGILYSGTKENIKEIIRKRDIALQED